MSASHWHYLLFAQPHILEGHHKFPQILRMVLENRRSGTCCAFILHGLKINLGPVKLIFFYSLYGLPFVSCWWAQQPHQLFLLCFWDSSKGWWHISVPIVFLCLELMAAPQWVVFVRIPVGEEQETLVLGPVPSGNSYRCLPNCDPKCPQA